MAQVTLSFGGRGHVVACRDGEEARVRQLAAMIEERWATAARALLVLPGVQTPRQSARQLARLVTDPDVSGLGTYVVRGRTGIASAAARDETAQRTLYEDTLALIATVPAA